MKLNPNDITPSQDFLKPNTMRFILECIANGNLADLPPAPIVRQDAAGNYVAIDGHNLIAVKAHRGEDIEVHLAKDVHDGLPPDSEQNQTRNQDLLDKFEECLRERDRVAAEGIRSFQDLIQQNEELFSQATR